MKQLKKVVIDKMKSGKPVSRATAVSRKIRANPGHTVLYIGHLPREFEERELAHFLKQFGRVVNLRLARSKRTEVSKGYGFFQMSNDDTARIVADTLSGYILMGKRRLVCHVVPPEKVHARLFFKREPVKKKPEANRSLKRIKLVTYKLVARERKKKALLQKAGIDFDFPGYEAGRNATNAKQGDDDEPLSETNPDSGKKKRKNSIDGSDKKKRKESIDGTEKKKRSDSVDSSSKKKRSDSVDSATNKKKRKDSIGSVEQAAVSTPASSKKRSDSVDSSSSKKKKENNSAKKRTEEEAHDDSPKAKKRKNSMDKVETPAAKEKVTEGSSARKSSSKKSKKRLK